MDSPAGKEGKDASNEAVFDKSYRMKQLSKIEENIAKLLRSAGEALQALTLQSTPAESGNTIDERKAAFSKAASEYFAALSYVDVHLRREIYALEEASIIPSDFPKDVTGPGEVAKSTIPTGALGGLDVGWLNSRSDKVGVEMRAELWLQAKEVLEGLDLNSLFQKVEKTNDLKEDQKLD